MNNNNNNNNNASKPRTMNKPKPQAVYTDQRTMQKGRFVTTVEKLQNDGGQAQRMRHNMSP